MEKKLENIIDKIHCLFQKYGIKSVTMDDVSRELGISKKTLYQFFNDKHDLIEKIAERKIELSKIHTELMEKSNLDAIEELVYLSSFTRLFMKT